MNFFDPILQLPVAGSVLDGHQDSTLPLQQGNYRIQNAASGRCLSFTARQTKRATKAGPNIAGWACGVPGKDDDLNQIWTVRLPPKAQNAPPSLSKADPRVYIFETTSPLLSTTSGARHQFRLDLANDAPAITPVIATGRSSIPNNLQPPSLPMIPLLPSKLPIPSPTPTPFPVLTSYVETLLASPKGAATSLWQILQIRSDLFHNQYLLFNPSSRLYVGHTPSASTSLSSTSLVSETAGDGSPIQAVDLERYLKDVAAWLLPKPSANSRKIVANVDAQLRYFAWSLRRADYGPGPGGYRIVHDKTVLAINGLQQLAADTINPRTKTQIWNVAATATSTGGIEYSVFNHSSQNPLFSGRWRLMYVPPEAVDTALAIPNPMPRAPTPFLLMDQDSNSPLGLDRNKKFTTLRVSAMALPSEGLDDVAPNWDNVVIRHMVEHIKTFRSDHASLIWRLYPETWAPEDGIYSFSNESSFLDIPPSSSSAVSPVLLSPAYSFPPVGSTWWRVASHVDDSSGAIYQTVTNYRSGHVLDGFGPELVPSPVVPAKKQSIPKERLFQVVARRSGDVKDEQWRLVATKDGDAAFAVQDFATYGDGVSIQSGVVAYGSFPEIDRTWTVRRVGVNRPDVGLPDGRYFILSLASDLFLSAPNAVALGQTPVPWFFSTTPKGRSISTPGGSTLGALSGNAVIDSGLSPIALGLSSVTLGLSTTTSTSDTEGGFLIVLISDSTVLTENSGTPPSFSALSTSRTQRWRIISLSDPINWKEPSWRGLTRSGGTPNLSDGVYRVTNRQSKACLVLADGMGDRAQHEVSMSMSAKEASLFQLWYIERNRHAKTIADSSPQTAVPTYILTNLSQKLNLQERMPYEGQPYEGISLCVQRNGQDTPEVISTQRWMFWKPSNIQKPSANGWIIQAVGGSGGLLDYSDPGLLSTRPQLEATPTATQVWQLDKLQPEFSSGFYSLCNIAEQSFLTFASRSTFTTGPYEHVDSDWKVVAQPNGLYTLQSVANLAFMTASKGLTTKPSPEYWMLLPSSEGVIVQHLPTRKCLTDSKGTVALTNAGTKWVMRRTENPSPSFNDLPSAKVPPAKYAIVNVGTGRTLNWPAAPAFGTGAICTQSGPRWTLRPTGGFYSISLSDLAIGSGAVASPAFLDSSMWKLLKFDTGNYRIVNKSSGLLLSQSAQGTVIVEVQDLVSNQRDEWEVAQDPNTVQKTPANLEREVPITNGIYALALSNDSASRVITLPTLTSAPGLSLRDLSPYSTSSRTQLWIIEQTRDGWYIIKSFPYGAALGYEKRLICSNDDASDNFRWNFIQDIGGNIRCVAKTNVMLALSATESLDVLQYTGTANQIWNLIRASGTPSDTKLPQGAYILSKYIVPTISGLRSQAAAAARTLNSDAAAAVKQMILEVSTAYGHPASNALPTGVDTAQLQASLAKISADNSPAVTAIVIEFFGALYTASSATTPTAGSNAASGTTAATGAAGPGRTLALSDASKQVEEKLVAFCAASVVDPNPDPNPRAQQISDICSQSQLLTDLTAAGISSNMMTFGQEILNGVAKYLATRNAPTQPADLNSSDSIGPPPTLTLNSGSLPTISPLVTQSLSQYFLIESTGDGLSISHLTLKQSVSVINNTVVLSPHPFPWTISLQRLGGYAIFFTKDTVLSLSLTLVPFVPDGGSASDQRWQLQRTGYYLQNKGDGNFSSLASANPDSSISLTPWRPFSQALLTKSKDRSDALNTWHMDKVSDGQYRLYNEHTRTLLRNSMDSDNNIITTSDLGLNNSDLWQFAKNKDDLWLQCQDPNNPKKWLASGPGSRRLNLQDPGDKEKWKGWQLISLAATERGLLTSLPRFALVTSDQRVYNDPGPGPAPMPVQYAPDNSHQRYRSYTYATNTIYINEATTRLLKSDGTSTDLMNTDDPSVWWTLDDQTKKTVPKIPGDSLFTPVSNTGDLMPSNISTRIQLANGQALSVSNGSLVAEDLDRMSTRQTWTYLDWAQGRYISHVDTSLMLGFSGTNVTLSARNAYSSSTLWTIDTTSALVPNNNGFFPIRPVTNVQVSIQPNLNVSPTLSGIRFVKDSSWMSFTTRSAVLKTFINAHAPVFCYADKSIPLPVSVDYYLTNSTLLPAKIPATTADLSTGTSLVYNGPPSDGQHTAVYIIVRDSPDAAYVNYSDFTFYLLYVTGWTHVTLRYNNESNNLECAWFPNLGWIYNLDSNYSTCLGTDNPLKLLLRPDGTTRLHVYVGASGAVPSFPPKMQDGAQASVTEQNAYITTNSWAMVLDAMLAELIVAAGQNIGDTRTGSTKGASGIIVDASMIADDENGAGVIPPDWAEWGGMWGQTRFP